MILELVARIDVCKDRLTVQFKTEDAEETSDSSERCSLSIPWQATRAASTDLPYFLLSKAVSTDAVEERSS